MSERVSETITLGVVDHQTGRPVGGYLQNPGNADERRLEALLEGALVRCGFRRYAETDRGDHYMRARL